MTLQQLEYIVAVDDHRHFVKAAEACKVTQPTLSYMIQKLEEELDLRIFDRNAHPIAPTMAGKELIKQSRIVLYNAAQLKQIATAEKKETCGNLHLAVIPTVAPLVLPNFFPEFQNKYPEVSLKVSEMQTSVILDKLMKAQIDMAILATPLEKEGILEIPLFYEKFIAYVSPDDELYALDKLDPRKMPLNNLWVLQEGHCLRGQIFNFCSAELSKEPLFEAGSIDTLIKIVDFNGGYTIIPELYIPFLSKEQQQNLRYFIDPEPVREISIIIREDFVREALLNAVAEATKTFIPEHMLDSRLKKFAIKL